MDDVFKLHILFADLISVIDPGGFGVGYASSVSISGVANAENKQMCTHSVLARYILQKRAA